MNFANLLNKDLRRKFLQAYDEGEDSQEELARTISGQFELGEKISARRSRTGEVDAPVWWHGPVSRVTTEVQVWMEADPLPAGYNAPSDEG